MARPDTLQVALDQICGMGAKISGWLHGFPGKLAVHPGVGVTQLTISKFLRNAHSSSAVQPPAAFEQLEYF